MTAIIFGSTTGNTEKAAGIIKEKLGDGAVLVNVADLGAADLSGYDRILLGTSTWGEGELQDDWYSGIDIIRNADLKNKKAAVFGCGDQQMYPDTFVDGMGMLYEALLDAGAGLCGSTETAGYEFSCSAAVVNGRFVGLAIDEDNQPELSESRIEAWLKEL